MVQPVIDAKVVFLTHYIPLYQVRVLQCLSEQIRDFQILLSTPIEPNREFRPDWSGLNVTVQNTWTFKQKWRHNKTEGGFQDALYVHVPTDTAKRLRELRPDVVMSLELGARSLGVIRYCKKNPDTKSLLCTYMSKHTEQSRGRMRTALRRWLVKRADALTYNGPDCKDYLDSIGADPDKLFHLPYAADDRTTYNGAIAEETAGQRQRLLCVGQLSDRKGVLPLAMQLSDYCKARPDQQVELLIAGNGPLKEAIERVAAPENLDIQLLGNVPSDSLGDLMTSCGAVIAPTLADEWLLVVNEAMHAGVPVIGSIYAQAVTTLVQDGYNGWQYDPTNERSLADVLDQYFGLSATKIDSMRLAARESISERTPNWAASGALDAIRQLLNP